MDVNIYLEGNLTTWSFRKPSVDYPLKPIDSIATDFDHAYSTGHASSFVTQASNPESVFFFLLTS